MAPARPPPRVGSHAALSCAPQRERHGGPKPEWRRLSDAECELPCGARNPRDRLRPPCRDAVGQAPRVRPTDARVVFVAQDLDRLLEFTPDLKTPDRNGNLYPDDPYGNDDALLQASCDRFSGLAYLRLSPTDGRSVSWPVARSSFASSDASCFCSLALSLPSRNPWCSACSAPKQR